MSEGYKLYGGNGVEVEPLEVSEDGTYTAPLGKAFNPVKVSGGGSGGGGALFVEFTYDSSEHYTSVASASDVVAAFFAGTPVMCHFPSEEGGPPNDIVKTVTWILRPPVDGGGGSTEIGFDPSEDYITYSGIDDDHIVCSVYIPD